MSQQLTNIAVVIDMDGFFVNKSFFCKELGFLSVGDATAQFFDTGLQ
jgi:hypothetical protein